MVEAVTAAPDRRTAPVGRRAEWPRAKFGLRSTARSSSAIAWSGLLCIPQRPTHRPVGGGVMVVDDQAAARHLDGKMRFALAGRIHGACRRQMGPEGQCPVLKIP